MDYHYTPDLDTGSGYDVTEASAHAWTAQSEEYGGDFWIGDDNMSMYYNASDYTTSANLTDDNLIPFLHPPYWLTCIIATLMFSVIFAAILGNLLVIISVLTNANLQIISNSFIVSLAFADLLVASSVMPFSASQWIMRYWLFNQTVCDIFNANDVLFSTASLVHLCCISMDRYIAITDPFHYHRRMTRKRVALMLCLAWGISALISNIPVHTGIYSTKGYRHIIYPYYNEPDKGLCLFVVNRVYAIISSSLSFWIPAFTMVFTYAMVFREARKQERKMALQQRQIGRSSELQNFNGAGGRGGSIGGAGDISPRSNGAESASLNVNGHGYQSEPRRMSNERKFKREHKAAKTLGVIMGGFLLCWLPFFLWYVITTLCGEERCPTPEAVIGILFWVGYFNSALNPMIYALLNTEFRKAFIAILRCQRLRRACTNYCCSVCVKRGWIRRPSDQESSYFADLPPISARPSISLGDKRRTSYYSNGNNKSSRSFNYDTVPEMEENSNGHR